MTDYDPTLRRDTPMARKLADRIRRSGPITVAAYMHTCLADPEHGYYVKQTAIGRDGDFITAPEISQTFGELIGLWSAVVWQQMGSPSRVDLVELGPGRGTLMADALRATARVPGFHDALSVHLVELNAALRAEQQRSLAGHDGPITWQASISDYARTRTREAPAIVIGNEFLDTCPVSQLLMGDGNYHERGVGVDERGALQFGSAKGPFAIPADEAIEVSRLSPGRIVETQNYAFLHVLRLALTGAPHAMLFIDYGYTGPSSADTLQAVRHHRHEHPLTSPGEADLTAYVSFDEVTAFATSVLSAAPPLIVDGPVPQGEFLSRLGIVERASKLMSANPAKAGTIEAGVARLLSPRGMGTRFLAIGLRSPALPVLPGFER